MFAISIHYDHFQWIFHGHTFSIFIPLDGCNILTNKQNDIKMDGCHSSIFESHSSIKINLYYEFMIYIVCNFYFGN